MQKWKTWARKLAPAATTDLRWKNARNLWVTWNSRRERREVGVESITSATVEPKVRAPTHPPIPCRLTTDPSANQGRSYSMLLTQKRICRWRRKTTSTCNNSSSSSKCWAPYRRLKNADGQHRWPRRPRISGGSLTTITRPCRGRWMRWSIIHQQHIVYCSINFHSSWFSNE